VQGGGHERFSFGTAEVRTTFGPLASVDVVS
jgi:hypothetical protein